MFQLLRKLEEVNDYETLSQDVDRLIGDLQFKDNLQEKINYIKKFK